MNDQNKIDPNHNSIRDLCRIIGPLMLVVGILFIAVGMISFFAAFGGSGPPKLFWCAFIGMPLAAFGSIITKIGYMGKIARYMSGEISPVAKDTFNYMADGTQQGVKTVATAIGQGIGAGVAAAGGGEPQTIIRCHKCNNTQEEDAKFCSDCGTPLEKSKPCPSCNELNDPDAKFCDNCGKNF